MHSGEDKVQCGRFRQAHGLNREKQDDSSLRRPRSASKNTAWDGLEDNRSEASTSGTYIAALRDYKNNPVPRVPQKRQQKIVKLHSEDRCSWYQLLVEGNKSPIKHEQHWKHKYEDTCKELMATMKKLDDIRAVADDLEEENKTLKNNVIDLEKEQESYRGDYNELLDTYKELETSEQKYKKESKELAETVRDEIYPLQQKNNTLQKHVETLSLEKDALNKMLDTEVQQHRLTSAELENYKKRSMEEKNSINNEIATLKAKLDETKSKLERTDRNEDQNSRLQNQEHISKVYYETQIRNLKQEKLKQKTDKEILETKYEGMKKEMRKQLQQKETELKEKQLELEHANRKLRNVDSDSKAVYETQTAKLQQEKHELEDEKADVDTKYDTIRTEVSKLRKTLASDSEEHQKLLHRKDDEIKQTKVELENIKTSLRDQIQISKDYETQLVSIKQDKLQLERRNVELETKYNVINTDLQKQLRQKENEMKDTRQELEKTKRKLQKVDSDSKGVYETQIAKLQQKKQELEEEKEDIETKYDHVKKEVSKLRNTHARDLEAQHCKDDEIKKIKVELENIKTRLRTEESNSNTFFEAKLANVQQEKLKLEESKSDIEAKYDKMKNKLQEQLHLKDNELEERKQELEHIKTRFSRDKVRMENEIDGLRIKLGHINTSLTEAKQNAKEKIYSLESVASKTDSKYNKDIARLQQNISDLENMVERISKENETLKADNNRQKQTLEMTSMETTSKSENMEREYRKCSDELNAARARLRNISKDIESKDKKNAELREMLNVLHKTIKHTKEETRAMDLEKDNLISKHKDEVSTLEKKTRDLKRHSDELSKENDQLNNLHKQTQNQSAKDLDILKQRLDSTEMELNDARKRVRTISEDKIIQTNTVSELKNRLANVEQTYQQMSKTDDDKVKAVEKAKSNLMTQYKNEVSAYKEEISDLKRQVHELSEDNEEFKDISKQNQKLLNDTETLRKRLQRTELELTDTKTRLQNKDINSKALFEGTLSNLEQEKHRLHECNASLERQNTQINKEMAEIQTRLRSDCDEQQNQLYSKDKELRETESELENVKTRLRKITEADTQKSKKIEELRNRLSDLEKKFHQTDKNADENVKALERENAGLVTDYNNMKKRIEDLVTENNRLKNQYKQNEKQSLNDVDGIKQRLQTTEIQLTEARKMLKQEKQNANMYEAKIAKLQQEKQTLGECKSDLEAKNDQMKGDIITLKNRLDSNQSSRYTDGDSDAWQRRLRRKEEELKAVELELEDTKTRLSKCMGDKLTNNNPNIVDLSDMNRPSKLADRYKELYDNQWTDAYEILEKSEAKEEQIIRILLNVLIETKRFCDDQTQMEMKATLRAITQNDKVKSSDVPVGVIKYIKDCRKASAAKTMRVKFKEYVTDLKGGSFQFTKQALTIKEYLHECFEICWLMAIQDPPVVLASLLNHGDKFRTDLYCAYTVTGKIVDYSVWPALLLHDNGPTLTKGVAQGIKKS